MKILVPSYAYKVTNQNVLVLLWLMKKLGKLYPTLKKSKKILYPKKHMTFIEFGFYPHDLHMILQSARDSFREIDDAGLTEFVSIGQLTMHDSVVRMRNTQASFKAEITDQRCIELICYLSGCLNNNLIETEKPAHYFCLEKAIKNHFVYYGKD